MRPPAGSSDPEPFLEHSISSGGAQPSAKAIFQQRKNYAKSAASLGEVSEYRVEHLVTFSMERKEAILTVDDSIRKLQLLDARGKVWTQEIFMQVDNKSVKLADMDTKEELEVFPLTSFQHIQSVIDSCSYNSICALVVKDIDQKNPDIHLFQCSTVPADVICADINSAFKDIKNKKGQKSRPETLRRHRETIEATTRPPNTPPINVKDRVAEWTNAIEAQNETPPLSARTSMNEQAENSPEVQAFKIHRDVQMLNHSLDDIELFVSLLQKSADANRELTVRQSKKKLSKRGKGKSPGSGLMELRARLPPKEHFLEVFQKFRFCFNLLSKLKTHIKDPDSVTLTHFLFQPLTMIINTCCGPELARTVRTPLHHRDTIDFLRGCLTPNEMQLWFDLGDFWTKSKTDFPKDMFFPRYVPMFTSGWVPPPIPSMESEPNNLSAAIQGQANHVQRVEVAWKAGGAHIEDALKPLSPVSPADPGPTRKQSSFNGRRTSMAFKQHVENHVARNQAAQFLPSSPAPPRKLCRAMYDFTARTDRELSVRMDDLLDVLDDSKSWWKVQNNLGETGYVPENLMLLISSATKQSNEHSTSVPPPPPPPPPAPSVVPVSPPTQTPFAPAPFTSASLNSVVLKKTIPSDGPKRGPNFDSNNLQAELRQRVSAQKQRNFVLPKKNGSSSSLVINRASSSHSVREWLLSLGFSDITVSSLGVLTGAQIFSLTKEELIQLCDEEGPRVNSQLMIQRSMDGFATTTDRSELGRIMKLRREVIPNQY